MRTLLCWFLVHTHQKGCLPTNVAVEGDIAGLVNNAHYDESRRVRCLCRARRQDSNAAVEAANNAFYAAFQRGSMKVRLPWTSAILAVKTS